MHESQLLKYIKEKYLPVRFSKNVNQFTQKDVEFFAKGMAMLSDSFTCERNSLPQNYFNKKEFRSSYLLYFTLTNYEKTMKCLNEAVLNCPELQKASRLKILDIGCGPATAAIASSNFFKQKDVSILGVDQNREILNDGRELFSLFARKGHKFSTINKLVNSHNVGAMLPREEFDIIIAANILNEIDSLKEQELLCQRLVDGHLKKDGVFIIIDPALQKTTRMLMELRDMLNAIILAPCLHQKFCPMLAYNNRDWCHFYLEWDCPSIIKRLDRLLGIKHYYLKMAYLILKKGAKDTLHSEKSNLWRVVSSPLNSKGKCEFVLCGNGVLSRITRLDRDRSKQNSQFDLIKRGDVIKVPDGVTKIHKETNLAVEMKFNNSNNS